MLLKAALFSALTLLSAPDRDRPYHSANDTLEGVLAKHWEAQKRGYFCGEKQPLEISNDDVTFLINVNTDCGEGGEKEEHTLTVIKKYTDNKKNKVEEVFVDDDLDKKLMPNMYTVQRGKFNRSFIRGVTSDGEWDWIGKRYATVLSEIEDTLENKGWHRERVYEKGKGKRPYKAENKVLDKLMHYLWMIQERNDCNPGKPLVIATEGDKIVYTINIENTCFPGGVYGITIKREEKMAATKKSKAYTKVEVFTDVDGFKEVEIEGVFETVKAGPDGKLDDNSFASSLTDEYSLKTDSLDLTYDMTEEKNKGEQAWINRAYTKVLKDLKSIFKVH